MTIVVTAVRRPTLRIDPPTAGLAIALAVGLPALLWLGRGMTFFSDEWAFIETRSLGDPGTWLPPHNEHWSTLPILVYRLLVETVGLTSYVWYEAVVIGLHGIVVVLAFVLIRRSAGGAVALAAALVILAFGSGFENLYWGFQIGFVGATAAGLGSMLAAERDTARGRAVSSLLLLVSLATVGIGVVFAAILIVESIARRRLRAMALPLSVPIAVYAWWYVAFGRSGLHVTPEPRLVLDVIETVLAGFGNAVGGVFGIGPSIGLVAAVGMFAVLVVRLARTRTLPPGLLGAFAGITVLYGVIGLTRAHQFDGIVYYTRYTYVSGILLAVGLASLARHAHLPSAPSGRLVAIGVGGSLLAVSLVFNVRLLIDGRQLFLDRAAMTRALVTVALDRPLPATTDPNRSLILVPSPASLERIVAAYGSPLSDSILPDAVEPIPASVLAEARRRLAEGVNPPAVGQTSPPTTAGTSHATAVPDP
jgi:hypothetical protein